MAATSAIDRLMFHMEASPSHHPLDALNGEFILVSEKIAMQALTIGVRITPFFNRSLPLFSKLTPEKQKDILGSLKTYLSIFENTLAAGEHIGNSQKLTWMAIKAFGLTPCSDLFSLLEPDDVIEIYDNENLQLFRNFRFFEFCSYSLEDIFCVSWPVLFRRPNTNVIDSIFTLLTKIHSECQRKTYSGDSIPAHIVEETDSPFMFKLDVGVKYISPLYGPDRKVAAIVAVEKVELLSQPLTSAEEEACLKRHISKMSYEDTI